MCMRDDKNDVTYCYLALNLGFAWATTDNYAVRARMAKRKKQADNSNGKGNR